MAESRDLSGNWRPLEKNPYVFTELIKHLGVKGVQVEELWNLDDEQLNEFRPIHGFFLLYSQYLQNDKSIGIVLENKTERIFFSKQVINNACVTQAILSILYNCKHPEVLLGPTLDEFKGFCQSFDANMKGLTLSNSDVIREIHNSFSSQTAFEQKTTEPLRDEKLHFISYVPIDGRLYELDGLNDGPVDLGPCNVNEEWSNTAKPFLQKKINEFQKAEINFSLMAIILDKKMLYERRKAHCCDPNEWSGLQMMIDQEIRKSKQYQIENIRRKHDYKPLIMELLKCLSEDGKLLPLYQKAKCAVNSDED